MGDHYIAFVKSNCSYCVMARDEFFRQRVHHTLYIMDDKPEILESIKNNWDHQTVPIILLETPGGDRKLIGGYDDLKKVFDSKEN